MGRPAAPATPAAARPGSFPSSSARRVVAPAASRRPVSPAAAAPARPSGRSARRRGSSRRGSWPAGPGSSRPGPTPPPSIATDTTTPAHPPAVHDRPPTPPPRRGRWADRRTGRGRESPCSPVCRGTCQPRGSPARILTNLRIGRLRTATDTVARVSGTAAAATATSKAGVLGVPVCGHVRHGGRRGCPTSCPAAHVRLRESCRTGSSPVVQLEP